MWREFNQTIFEGKLSEPTFRITRANRYYGDFGVTESSNVPTLRVSNRTNSSPQLLRDTILHEMVHQYLWETGHPDWYGHGDGFQQVARRIGVTIDHG